MRRLFLPLALSLALWLLLANHIILVPNDPAFVILKKTSWTFDSCFIGESSWSTFSNELRAHLLSEFAIIPRFS